MDRQVRKSGFLQFKMLKKTGTLLHKKKYVFEEQKIVALCVHDNKIPLLEWYSSDEDIDDHLPEKVVDLLDCNYVNNCIKNDRHLYIGFEDDKRPTIILAATNPEEVREWVESINFCLRDLNCLASGENEYQIFPEPSELESIPVRNSTTSMNNYGDRFSSDTLNSSNTNDSINQNIDLNESSESNFIQNERIQSSYSIKINDDANVIPETFSSASTSEPLDIAPQLPTRTRKGLEPPLPSSPPSSKTKSSNSQYDVIPPIEQIPNNFEMPKPTEDMSKLKINDSKKEQRTSIYETISSQPLTNVYSSLTPSQSPLNDKGYVLIPSSPKNSKYFESPLATSIPKSQSHDNEYVFLSSSSSYSQTDSKSKGLGDLVRPSSPPKTHNYSNTQIYQKLTSSDDVIPPFNPPKFDDNLNPSKDLKEESPEYVIFPSSPPTATPSRPMTSDDFTTPSSPPKAIPSRPTTSVYVTPPSSPPKTIPTKPMNSDDVWPPSSPPKTIPSKPMISDYEIPSSPPKTNHSYLQNDSKEKTPDYVVLPSSTPKTFNYAGSKNELNTPTKKINLPLTTCAHHLLLVEIAGSIWIAGWSESQNSILKNILHVGDQLLKVNNIQVHQIIHFPKIFYDSTKPGLPVDLEMRSVPHGSAFIIQKPCDLYTHRSFGIILHNKKNRISEIIPGSLAFKCGLSSKVKPFLYGKNDVPAVITEINGIPLNPFSTNEQFYRRIDKFQISSDIKLTIHPYDFVKLIKQELKKYKNIKQFLQDD